MSLPKEIHQPRRNMQISYCEFWMQILSSKQSFVAIICRNDELSSTMSWVGCLLKDSDLFILIAENSQNLLKISVIPILLTFIYLIAPTQLIFQLNSSLRQIIVTLYLTLIWVQNQTETIISMTEQGRKKVWKPRGGT